MSDPAPYLHHMTPAGLVTAEDLQRLSLPEKRTELVRGRLVVHEPAGYQHGVVAMRLGAMILQFVDQRRLGQVVAAETGFTLFRDPDTVRAPDVGFIRQERLPDPAQRGFAEIAPDLAVEVLSPGDSPGEVLAKVADWLRAGSTLVWVVDPIRRKARVYRAAGSESEIAEDGGLDGETVLPGFSCPLLKILQPPMSRD
jgi:Uma2 family endonuclease